MSPWVRTLYPLFKPAQNISLPEMMRLQREPYFSASQEGPNLEKKISLERLKTSSFPSEPKDQKKIEISSENDIFERATHRGPFFVGNSRRRDWYFRARLKISIGIENFERDWIILIVGPSGFASNFQSRLKISILTLRIPPPPHKIRGLVGGSLEICNLAWKHHSFHSRLKITIS